MTPAKSALRFDAAIFDFDETMVNLEQQHHAAYEALCRAQGDNYSEVPLETRCRSGLRVIDEIAAMKSLFGWKESLENLVRTRANLFITLLQSAEVEPLPGVRNLVSGLRKRGVTLAVTSSGMRDYIELLLGRMGLVDSFQRVIAGDQVSRPKPDPEPYLTTAVWLSIEPRRCVVFEDSEVGVDAAKRAGMHCVAVRNLYARQTQNLSAADLVVTTLEEVDVDSLLKA